MEDKSLKFPIVVDHVLYYVEESRLKDGGLLPEMSGAKPMKGEPDTLSMPGTKRVFSKPDTARAETAGRSLNHIAFYMLQAFAAT